MFGIVIAIHAIVCLLLMLIILVQRGRGGGLVEGFSNLDSMFGTKTNTFLSRTTTVLAIMFFFTCLSLAVFSARQGRSLMQKSPTETSPMPSGQPQPSQAKSTPENQTQPEVQPQPQAQPTPQIPPQQEANKTE